MSDEHKTEADKLQIIAELKAKQKALNTCYNRLLQSKRTPELGVLSAVSSGEIGLIEAISLIQSQADKIECLEGMTEQQRMDAG